MCEMHACARIASDTLEKKTNFFAEVTWVGVDPDKWWRWDQARCAAESAQRAKVARRGLSRVSPECEDMIIDFAFGGLTSAPRVRACGHMFVAAMCKLSVRAGWIMRRDLLFPNNVNASLQEKRHARGTSSSVFFSPRQHHHQSITTKASPPKHHHQSITTKASPPNHHHHATRIPPG